MTMLVGQIYEPKEGKYVLPIFVNDNAISAFTWQYIIDTYVANYGHKADEKLFKRHISDILSMIRIDVNETFELCKENILKEVESE